MSTPLPPTSESTATPPPPPNRSARKSSTARRSRLRLKRRRKRARPAMRYAMLMVGLVLVAFIAQFVVHTYRTEPRDARVIAERELRFNALGAGERVIRVVSVFQRPWIDYLRATRGVLVLTDRRLLFLGLEPRDLLGSGDGPPTFQERDFAVDTLLSVQPGRTFFGIAKALIVETPDGVMRFGVPAESWGRAKLLLHTVEARHLHLEAEAAAEQERMTALQARRARAAEAARQPIYYPVARGDALSSIAARWNTTTDQLREWNGLPDNRIRIGQRLLVKPAGAASRTAADSLARADADSAPSRP